MNAGRWTLAIGLALFLTAPAFGQASKPARLDELVRQLGSSSYLHREQARKEIVAIGTSALDALRKHRGKADLETSRRLDDLIQRFEEQLVTRQILAPKEIHLKLKDATVHEAIAELTKLSGYAIQFQGDASRIADKKITLDLGKTSFWQAFDRLSAEAGLKERIDPPPPPPQFQQPFPGGGRIRRIQRFPVQAPAPAGPIVLTNRGVEKSVVSYAGAIKTEVRVSPVAGAKEFDLTFTVSAEPRLKNTGVVGRPVLANVVDEQNRKLRDVLDDPRAATNAPAGEPWLDAVAMAMMQPPGRTARIRVTSGEQAAQALKELAGKLTMRVDQQNEVLARIDKVLDSAGKSVTGANGGTLKVNSIERKNNNLEVQVSLENLTQNPFGANVIINGGNIIIRGGNVAVQGMVIGPNGVQMNGTGNQRDLPDLVDAKGQKFQVAGVLAESTSIINGAYSRSLRIVYQPTPGQAEPRELVLFGTRTHTIGVPFRFENLPLP